VLEQLTTSPNRKVRVPAHDREKEEKMRRVAVLLGAVLLVLGMTLATTRAGAQPEIVTNDNLNQMIARAKTPSDHEAIAAYYDHEAANNQKMAELHRASENIYTKTTNVLHCKALIKSYQEAAREDQALAAWHRQMAKKAAGQ
jgi:hypothetical protein